MKRHLKFNGTPSNPYKRPERDYFRRKTGLPCDGCNKSCRGIDYYMVRDDVWGGEAGLPGRCILCLDCLQTRLGRLLLRDDFIDAPVNVPVVAALFPRATLKASDVYALLSMSAGRLVSRAPAPANAMK